ncbi:AfsR/SARP family transcriptional regulator [Paractinoplanes globisporus]|uniref:BTAD domain-containing putative transcriptional regulator n=1 Tax=Paractinoplanes globisporus TaxID=113565 RepID=A0ABW6W542_9ACTN|nr:AfsR/SARP family transcriptional regulator [Actinoplanes globisporus]
MSGPAFSLLGPVRAWRDGVELPLGSPQQRTTLAVLLLRSGRVTTTEDLVDALWPDDPPVTAVGTVRTYLSRLRRALPGAEIEWVSGCYQLEVPPDAVDVFVFRRRTRAAAEAMHRGDHATAAALLRKALDLHRGTPLAGTTGYFLAGQRARLAEQCRAAVADLAATTIELGRPADAVARLRGLVAEQPLAESYHGLLMTALCRAGRPADALAHYEKVRRLLADQLGVRPSAELRELHRRILVGDGRVLQLAVP